MFDQTVQEKELGKSEEFVGYGALLALQSARENTALSISRNKLRQKKKR